jgi:hypothetical protein
MKARLPMFVTDTGTVTDFNAAHPRKALEPIDPTALLNVTEDNRKQRAKVHSAIAVICGGSLTPWRLLHRKKAPAPIWVTDAGSGTDRSDVHP